MRPLDYEQDGDDAGDERRSQHAAKIATIVLFSTCGLGVLLGVFLSPWRVPADDAWRYLPVVVMAGVPFTGLAFAVIYPLIVRLSRRRRE
jgi:hypothetical protein